MTSGLATTAVPEQRLVRPSRTAVQRCAGWHGSGASCPCELNRQPDDHTSDHGAGSPVPGSVRDVLRGPGRALEDAARLRMRERLGHDFAKVRVHDDERAASSAREVTALAYTVGEHVVLDRTRLPGASSDRDTVLAHELVHTLQNGRLADSGLPERVSHPGDPAERDATQIAHDTGARGPAGGLLTGSAGGIPAVAAPALHRDPPGDRPDWGISLQLREDGRLDVTVNGPKAPVVGNPEMGIRRRPDGSYTFLFGAQGHVVAADEIPELLRGMVHAGPGSSPGVRTFRVPTCAQLRTPDGTRRQTYDEYRIGAMLTPDSLPLSRTLYDAVLGQCQSAAPAERTPAPEPGSRPEPVPEPSLPALPEGEAYA